jgi:hypothetical protein
MQPLFQAGLDVIIHYRLDPSVGVLCNFTNLVKCRRSVVCKAPCFWQASSNLLPSDCDIVHLAEELDRFEVVPQCRRAYLSPFSIRSFCD